MGVRMLPKEILLTAKSASLTRESAGAPRAVRPGAGRSDVSGSAAAEEGAASVALAAAAARAANRRGRLFVCDFVFVGEDFFYVSRVVGAILDRE